MSAAGAHKPPLLLQMKSRSRFGRPRSSLESARKRCIFGVERKQIPHLRVMGRNIGFLKSELEPFRATFRFEVGCGKT
jgi:hypothetical protein